MILFTFNRLIIRTSLVRAVVGTKNKQQQTKGSYMKKTAILLALALSTSAVSLMAQDQTPPPAAGERPPGHEGGPGGMGRQGGRGGFHLLPPRAQEQLNLSADQQKQVAALEAETMAKLEKILTPEQMQKLKQMRPPMRGGGQGGQGGRGSRGPDGQGGGPGGPGQEGAEAGPAPQPPAQQ